MRKLTFLFILLALVSCKNHSPKAAFVKNESIPDTNVLIRRIELDCPLPENYKLDSIKYFDKNRNAAIIISLPISGISNLDTVIKKQLVAQRDSFLIQIDKFIKNDSSYVKTALTSDFFAEPISIYSNAKLISYSFIISFYYTGAPHDVSDFLSINYDFENKKFVDFSDYFLIETKEDSTFFKDIITKAINRDGITVNKIKNIDFNLEKDTISFNFGHYEISNYAEGLIHARVTKSKLINKIKINYR
jgi:hypothetical protein